jgi:hypothetical protein
VWEHLGSRFELVAKNINLYLNYSTMPNFTMSLPELEIALEAALNLSRSVCQKNGMGSKDYLRVWRMVEEMQAEIAARCAHQVCA